MQRKLHCAVALLETEPAAALRAFVRAQAGRAGGYRDRSGNDDLYYTLFGLALATALEVPPPAGMAAYLDAFGDGADLDFVHRVCLLRSLAMPAGASAERVQSLLGRIDEYRSADGGYHHQHRGAVRGSAYGAFLGLLAYEDAGAILPRAARLASSVRALHPPAADGHGRGAADRAVSAHLAAALVTLARLEGAPEAILQEGLHARRAPAGGYVATAGAPWPDMISTATALFALHVTGASLAGADAAMGYVESLWHAEGGFVGGAGDSIADTEHTFYGLLALGCLAEACEGVLSADG